MCTRLHMRTHLSELAAARLHSDASRLALQGFVMSQQLTRMALHAALGWHCCILFPIVSNTLLTYACRVGLAVAA